MAQLTADGHLRHLADGHGRTLVFLEHYLRDVVHATQPAVGPYQCRLAMAFHIARAKAAVVALQRPDHIL